MPTLSKLLIMLAGLGIPSAGFACSCTWFFTSVEDAELRAVAADVSFIVAGGVIADSTPQACTEAIAENASVPVYRTLRIRKVIKGKVPDLIKVHVGEVTSYGQRCAGSVNSCEVSPRQGASGIWALERKAGEWKFAGVCSTDAVRRVAVLDGQMAAKEAGGEIDAVRRHEHGAKSSAREKATHQHDH